MALAVIERPARFGGELSVEEREAATLAVALFRAVLYDLILGRDELDVEALKRWERVLRGGRVRDYSITRHFLAIARARRRLRAPENLSAYLLYRLSHGGHPERPDWEFADPKTLEPGMRRCLACGAPVDEARRARMVERIRRGHRLRDVKTPLDCEDFVGTHLTQAEVFELVGHEVSFSYQERRIREAYEELERRGQP